MENDSYKEAELRGYSKGYAAGQRRLANQMNRERIQRQDQRFLDQAFFAALTTCVSEGNWSKGEKKLNTLDGRVQLAWEFAESALKQRRHAR